MTLPSPPWAETALTTPPCADLLLEEESCADTQDGELDGLWTTISIFITLFLLSVCYSATVTLFKVGGHPTGPSGPLSVPGSPQCPSPSTDCPSLPTRCPLPVPGSSPGEFQAALTPLSPTGEVDPLISGGAETVDHSQLPKHDRAGRLELLWATFGANPDLTGPLLSALASQPVPGLFHCLMNSLTLELTATFACTSELWHYGHHCLPQPPSQT